MAPEVLLRKLAYMEELLRDLNSYQDAPLSQIEEEHYKLERIFELLATVSSDLLFHLLAEQGQRPSSYRETFRMAVDAGLLPAELGDRLAQVAAMRNILVHFYERIDYTILHASIRPAIEDFGAFVTILLDRSKQ
jgi:uncharacterized protein YutE (UPF0331/DUF86 family)